MGQTARLSSLLSTALQDGQTKISRSRRTPDFEIVRECFMVSPQHTHSRVSGTIGCPNAILGVGVDGR